MKLKFLLPFLFLISFICFPQQKKFLFDNTGWNVEKRVSLENNNWSVAGFVKGAGTNNLNTVYSFNDKNILAGTFGYRLKQIDQSGISHYSNAIYITVNNPAAFVLGNNYPNPFNPETKTRFEVPFAGVVNLAIFNILGQKVADLVNGYLEQGVYEKIFSSAIPGMNLSSGTYFYVLKAGNTTLVQKMLLLK
jgi:hypothetical protein